jgi:hypothetical protein
VSVANSAADKLKEVVAKINAAVFARTLVEPDTLSFTLCSELYALPPTTCALHPTLCTLHSTLYTRQLNPRVLGVGCRAYGAGCRVWHAEHGPLEPEPRHDPRVPQVFSLIRVELDQGGWICSRAATLCLIQEYLTHTKTHLPRTLP